jgi:aspartyl-tRNA(Asn)/glutamyl-tRNA(Gln) amidotransferase subunit B
VRKLAVNWTMVELVGHLHAQGQDLVNGPVSAEQLGQLVALLASEQVYGKAGKAVVKLLVEAGGEWAGADPRDVVKAHDWGTAQASELDVCEVVRQVVFSDEFGEELRVYRNGKKNLAMFFVGQVMKLTKGKAPPKQVNLLVRQVLDEDEAAQQQKNDNK